jgi:FAD/FMN-containing dehydrogenase
VGIAGLTLGGGLGILGRSHGLTSDHLLMAQVVLADGRVVECDEHHDAELFWALRGAGGAGFGVVTSLVFGTLPGPDATSFHLEWPRTEAAALVEAWQAWAPPAPDGLAASLLVKAGGAHLIGAMLGGESDTTDLLDRLVARVGSDPQSAAVRHGSYREAKRRLVQIGEETAAEGPEDGHPFIRSEFFRQPVPAEAVAALVQHFYEDTAAGQSRELDLTPWGAAYNRIRPGATAFAHRDERFLLKHSVVVDPGADSESARRWLERSWELVHSWGSGGVYPNFPEPGLDRWAEAYWGENRERLLRVKASYDPDGVFSSTR